MGAIVGQPPAFGVVAELTPDREALAVIEGVAAGLEDDLLRQKFLTSPHVKRIREAA